MLLTESLIFRSRAVAWDCFLRSGVPTRFGRSRRTISPAEMKSELMLECFALLSWFR